VVFVVCIVNEFVFPSTGKNVTSEQARFGPDKLRVGQFLFRTYQLSQVSSCFLPSGHYIFS